MPRRPDCRSVRGMKPLSVNRTVVGAGLAVTVEVAGRTLFKAMYARVPEYHAFWSGVVLYAGILLIWWGPAALTFVVLRGRTRFAAVATGLVGACFVVALVATASSDRPGLYWVIYALLVLIVFAGTAVQRRREHINAPG